MPVLFFLLCIYIFEFQQFLGHFLSLLFGEWIDPSPWYVGTAFFCFRMCSRLPRVPWYFLSTSDNIPVIEGQLSLLFTSFSQYMLALLLSGSLSFRHMTMTDATSVPKGGPKRTICLKRVILSSSPPLFKILIEGSWKCKAGIHSSVLLVSCISIYLNWFPFFDDVQRPFH